MKVFGLTGGIGSGKSTVAQFFEQLGAPSVDADQIARRLREPGQKAHDLILKRFGTTDRFQLRAILSTDPQAKSDLESILHPLIKTESDLELQKQAQAHPSAPFLVYEASLLIEAGRANDFDGMIVVTSPETDRIRRIMERDRVTLEAAKAMIQAQLTDQERLKYAHFVIKNEGSLQDLRAQVQKTLDQIISA